MAAPERTCLGCRQRRPQGELVRLTAAGGSVAPAWPGAPGRGAYLCAAEECLEAAQKRRAFARAFRGPVNVDPAVRREVARREQVQRGSAGPAQQGPAAAADERW
jgi:uncharacterized protein